MKTEKEKKKKLLKFGSYSSLLMYGKKLCGIRFYHSLLDVNCFNGFLFGSLNIKSLNNV